MKGIGEFAVFQPVGALLNLPDLLYADKFIQVGQRSVVGRHNILPLAGLCHNALSTGTYSGVNDRDKDGAQGPVIHRLKQAVGCLEHIVRSNIVGHIADDQLRGNLVGDPLHCAHRTVYKPEVTLKHKKLIHTSKLPVFMLLQG